MSMIAMGQFECDRCGADVGNGGIQTSVVLTFLDKEAGSPVNLNFCLDRIENGVEIRGCEHKVLSPSNIEHYKILKEKLK